ncbi:MAG: amidohydrolase family protein [Gemmatimonadaceae bacterium]|nr:amidohydrolase family protein [Gemmatimonadaceae bacterium]
MSRRRLVPMAFLPYADRAGACGRAALAGRGARLVWRSTRALAAATLVAVTAWPTLGAQEKPRTDTLLAFVGATLIDGTGAAPLADATIVVQGTRIAAVGSRGATPVPRGARVIDVRGKWITPGFVDANIHASIYSGIENFARYQDRFADIAVEAAQNHLKVGVTTVRDSYGMLGPLTEARDRIRRGEVPGPRMYVAGNIVGWGGPWSFSFTGRPPENLSLLQEQMNDAITQGGGEELVNMGPDSLRLAIDRYLDRGVDFLKYGGTSHFGYPVFIGFSERAQRVIVDAVHARGLVAETHSTTPEGLLVSLRAGVDLVQHPEVLDVPMSDEIVREFVDRKVVCAMLSNTMTGAPWIEDQRRVRLEDSTRQARLDSARARGTAQRERTEAEQRRDRGDRGMAIRRANAERLIRAGCITTIATDNYLGAAPEFRREPKPAWQDPGTGSLAAIEGLVELGMSPLEAIVAATRNGALASKALADYGTLERGKSADLLVLTADPIADIRNIRKLETVVARGGIVDLAALPTRRIWTRTTP